MNPRAVIHVGAARVVQLSWVPGPAEGREFLAVVDRLIAFDVHGITMIMGRARGMGRSGDGSHRESARVPHPVADDVVTQKTVNIRL